MGLLALSSLPPSLSSSPAPLPRSSRDNAETLFMPSAELNLQEAACSTAEAERRIFRTENLNNSAPSQESPSAAEHPLQLKRCVADIWSRGVGGGGRNRTALFVLTGVEKDCLLLLGGSSQSSRGGVDQDSPETSCPPPSFTVGAVDPFLPIPDSTVIFMQQQLIGLHHLHLRAQ